MCGVAHEFMRRILIDITRLFHRRLTGRMDTGIDRVSLEYIRHYADRARAVLTLGPFGSVLSRLDSQRAFDLLLNGSRNGAARCLRLIPKAYVRWWMGPDAAGCIFFNTSHTSLEQTSYAMRMKRWGVLPVFFVHDLIPITHPEYCRPGESERHARRMRTVVTSARGIIANSRDTLGALRAFAVDAGLRLPPAVVAPLAPSVLRAELGPRPIAEPYFVILGNIEPRKNHWLLLQVWRRMIEQLGGAAPRLVIIGQRGWECENVVDLLERCHALRGFVFEHNACSDRELVTYLHHAQALLYPSFVEGYGMPVAEALSLGVPVIASDLAVFREVAGNVPDYVDPLDGRRWMELITDYAGAGSMRRAAQLERIAGFRTTTWAQHLAAVDDFLCELIGRRVDRPVMG